MGSPCKREKRRRNLLVARPKSNKNVVVNSGSPCYIIAMQHKHTTRDGRPAVDKDMGYFHWTEAMSVGVPALDADHKSLIRTINVLRELDRGEGARSGAGMVLDTLKAYGRNHFKREERVMDAVRFPGAAFHRAEHQNFVRYVEFLRSRLATGDPELTRELYDYLTGWLRHHILIQDMAYKPYISSVADLESVAREAAPPLSAPADMAGIASLSA